MARLEEELSQRLGTTVRIQTGAEAGQRQARDPLFEPRSARRAAAQAQARIGRESGALPRSQQIDPYQRLEGYTSPALLGRGDNQRHASRPEQADTHRSPVASDGHRRIDARCRGLGLAPMAPSPRRWAARSASSPDWRLRSWPRWARRNPQGGSLFAALRAEAVKIGLIVILLWLVLATYRDVVVLGVPRLVRGDRADFRNGVLCARRTENNDTHSTMAAGKELNPVRLHPASPDVLRASRSVRAVSGRCTSTRW